MKAILSMIYCWLQVFWSSLTSWAVNLVDSALTVPDVLISSLPSVSLGSTDWASISTYTWVLGATGIDICIGIIGTALIIRFALASIPFVRWGS